MFRQLPLGKQKPHLLRLLKSQDFYCVRLLYGLPLIAISSNNETTYTPTPVGRLHACYTAIPTDQAGCSVV